MEPAPTSTVVDLADLERRLATRACWYDDPDAYREGVRDVLAALRAREGDEAGRVGPVTKVG